MAALRPIDRAWQPEATAALASTTVWRNPTAEMVEGAAACEMRVLLYDEALEAAGGGGGGSPIKNTNMINTDKNMINTDVDGCLRACCVARLAVVASAKFVECYAGGRYVKTERGSPRGGLFGFDIELGPRRGGGVSVFKFLRLNEPGRLELRDPCIDAVFAAGRGGGASKTEAQQQQQGNQIEAAGRGVGGGSGGLGDNSMLMTMIQMRQQMFEQKLMANIDQRFAEFQGVMMSKLHSLDERLQTLERNVGTTTEE